MTREDGVLVLGGKVLDNINKNYCCSRKGTQLKTISDACCTAVEVSALLDPSGCYMLNGDNFRYVSESLNRSPQPSFHWECLSLVPGAFPVMRFYAVRFTLRAAGLPACPLLAI